MTIRRAQTKDKKQLYKLFWGLHVGYHREDLLTGETAILARYKNPKKTLKKEFDNYFKGKKYTIFVAEESKKLIGYICGSVQRKTGKVYNKEGHIEDLYIVKERRNKGVGTKLIEVMINEFSKLKCTHLSIASYSQNIKAISLYRRLGYKDHILILKKRF